MAKKTTRPTVAKADPLPVVECPVCHGEYPPIQRDGSTYVHTCPDDPDDEE